MSYYKKMVGERLYLSPMNPDDAETYTRWINDLETAVNLTLSPKVVSEGKEREILQQISKEGVNFAIVELESDTLLGNCGLLNLDQVQRTAELGIFLGEAQTRGKGYGEEAIRLLLDFSFNIRNLHSVFLRVRSFNHPGIACYKKVGFKEIGRRRECVLIGGRYYDEVFMDILASEFTGKVPELMARKEQG